MKAVSHRQLGTYLAENYMSDIPRRYTQAFLLGCVEPDKNITTYFKGSIRNQWLRGHNWESADRYIRRVCRKLERKEKLHVYDYYNLGKLIHYTADAFTYTHNEKFQDGLHAHRQYEKQLHAAFPQYLLGDSTPYRHKDCSASEAIYSYHNDYVLDWGGVHTDAEYSVTVCTAVLRRLLRTAL